MKLEALQRIENTPQPTAGMGLSLDHNGLIPPLAVSGTWQTYTPALTGTTTNPTLGTGSAATGRYVQVGKTVSGVAQVQVGGAGFAAGTGTVQLSLPPLTPQADWLGGFFVVGEGWFFDSSVSSIYVLSWEIKNSLTTMDARYDAAGAANPFLTFAAPVATGQNDIFAGRFVFEIA